MLHVHCCELVNSSSKKGDTLNWRKQIKYSINYQLGKIVPQDTFKRVLGNIFLCQKIRHIWSVLTNSTQWVPKFGILQRVIEIKGCPKSNLNSFICLARRENGSIRRAISTESHIASYRLGGFILKERWGTLSHKASRSNKTRMSWKWRKLFKWCIRWWKIGLLLHLLR